MMIIVVVITCGSINTAIVGPYKSGAVNNALWLPGIKQNKILWNTSIGSTVYNSLKS